MELLPYIYLYISRNVVQTDSPAAYPLHMAELRLYSEIHVLA